MAAKPWQDLLHDIDRLLSGEVRRGKRWDRIYRIGIELEGGWNKLIEGMNLVADGSVRVQVSESRVTDEEVRLLRADLPFMERIQGYNHRDQLALLADEARRRRAQKAPKIHVGEFPSPILELNQWQAWMMKYYPTHVNNTCGLHVHFSFKKALHYVKLMEPTYQDVVVETLKRWATNERLPQDHPIWPRLKGENEFCKLEFFPDVQATKTKKEYPHTGVGNRYTAINYCHGLHGTLECRLLPMMAKAEQGIRAVSSLIDTTNAYLVARAEKEERISGEVEDAAEVNERTAEVLQPTRGATQEMRMRV